MIWKLYTIYDPATQSFDSRIAPATLDLEDMAEQYRRSFIVASDRDKAVLNGKKAMYIGEFDDVQGEIKQDRIVKIFDFKGVENEEEQEIKEECQDNSKSTQKQSVQN